MFVKFLKDVEIDTAIEFETDSIFKEGKVYELSDPSAMYWHSTGVGKLTDAPQKKTAKKKSK